tara:strand:- start:148 stop:288 length:141 start_codon:yes stop_codon:yes gene_type:complete
MGTMDWKKLTELVEKELRQYNEGLKKDGYDHFLVIADIIIFKRERN